jgi:hypothetical protein
MALYDSPSNLPELKPRSSKTGQRFQFEAMAYANRLSQNLHLHLSKNHSEPPTGANPGRTVMNGGNQLSFNRGGPVNLHAKVSGMARDNGLWYPILS